MFVLDGVASGVPTPRLGGLHFCDLGWGRQQAVHRKGVGGRYGEQRCDDEDTHHQRGAQSTSLLGLRGRLDRHRDLLSCSVTSSPVPRAFGPSACRVPQYDARRSSPYELLHTSRRKSRQRSKVQIAKRNLVSPCPIPPADGGGVDVGGSKRALSPKREEAAGGCRSTPRRPPGSRARGFPRGRERCRRRSRARVPSLPPARRS